ncbi:MAG: adenylyltransferase/cytidyltransferase family protein [bacterium]|nr:adenylyltransferase/cytidyltransferase family protein [bacterium]
MIPEIKTVMVFGTFDLLHDGHVHFLTESKKYGDRLIIALASDEVVLFLKGMLPFNSFAKRTANLSRLKIADEIVAGDERPGNWNVLRYHRPDVVALGYDQIILAAKLKKFLAKNPKPIELIYIGSHKGNRLHSSILRSEMLI